MTPKRVRLLRRVSAVHVRSEQTTFVSSRSGWPRGTTRRTSPRVPSHP